MGNNNSIEIKERSNGIFEVKAKDIENYPISYLRLCWNFDEKKYCIADECETEKTFLKRKILVVGMNLPGMDKIYEQCFYLSTGLNSIESLTTFFKKELIIKDKEIDLWLPFSGFGYSTDTIDNYNTRIKLLKVNFNCLEVGPTCSYGRFGNYEPNLMQISYCLGGKFWENNIDIINESNYDIKKLPNISSFFKSKIPCVLDYKKWNNIECSIYLNKYIASALPFNYSPYLLISRNRILKYFKPNKYFDWKDIKFDYRIIYILKEKKMLKFTTIGGIADLPYESSFAVNYWNIYLQNLNTLYNNELKFFIENILPIINEIIPYSYKNNLKEDSEKKEKEDVSYVIEGSDKKKIIKEDVSYVIEGSEKKKIEKKKIEKKENRKKRK